MVNNVKILTFDEIEAEEIRWLWKPYIALGKLTVIQGDPGNGKTTLALAIASLVSQGYRMPTGSTKPHIGNVIFQSGEDSPKDTIKPRLVACKANCSKIAFMDTECGLNLKVLEDAIVGLKATLVVIDPFQAFLSMNQDITSTKNMRPLLRELSNVAERTGSAIIIVGHMNKNDRTKGIYRGLGSIDITAAARSVLLIGKRKNHEHIRFMAQIKNNLTAIGRTISFTINKHGGVEFLGECDISEADLLSAAEERKTKHQIAKETIIAMLSDGDKKSNAVFDACINAGISTSTMAYVKKQLGIQSVRKIDDWYWTINQGNDDFGHDEYIQSMSLNNVDETPLVYLENILASKQCLTKPDQANQQSEQMIEKSNSDYARKTMESPFGELALIDWRACDK